MDDANNNNNLFARMLSRGIPPALNLANHQPAPSDIGNYPLSTPDTSSGQFATNQASAPSGNDSSVTQFNGLYLNNLAGMNFSNAGSWSSGLGNMMNGFLNVLQQQQQIQSQQQVPSQQQLQQPLQQQQAGIMNLFTNAPGTTGIMNQLPTSLQTQQAAESFPQNIAGMLDPSMLNSMGLLNAINMGNMQGLRNFMHQTPDPQASALPTAGTATSIAVNAAGSKSNDLEELKQKLVLSQQTQASALAQLCQNQTSVQGLNPMMMLGGATAAPMGQSPLDALAINQFSIRSNFNHLSHSNPQWATNTVSSNSNSAATSTTGTARAATDSLINATAIFNSHAQSLAALGALDASGLIASSEALKNVTTKAKKASKKKVKGKPKRPLSAYNLFFKEERERILESIPESDQKKRIKISIDGKGMSKSEENRDPKFDICHEKRCDAKDFDQKDKNGKKIPHGKIGFENLAKLIGKRWQELEPDKAAKYKKLAGKDMKRYKEEMEIFLTREVRAGLEGEASGTALLYNANEDSDEERNQYKRKSSDSSNDNENKKIKAED
ncbi:hypothetical protein ACHAXS_005654 [Conticribra weissflogii]